MTGIRQKCLAPIRVVFHQLGVHGDRNTMTGIRQKCLAPIRVVFHQLGVHRDRNTMTGIRQKCLAPIRVVFHQLGVHGDRNTMTGIRQKCLAPIRVVFHQGGLSSVWSFIIRDSTAFSITGWNGLMLLLWSGCVWGSFDASLRNNILLSCPRYGGVVFRVHLMRHW